MTEDATNYRPLLATNIYLLHFIRIRPPLDSNKSANFTPDDSLTAAHCPDIFSYITFGHFCHRFTPRYSVTLCPHFPGPLSTSHGVSSQQSGPSSATMVMLTMQWWTRSGRAEQDRDLHTVTMLPAFPTTTHPPAQPAACFIMSMSLAHVRSYLHIYTSSLKLHFAC